MIWVVIYYKFVQESNLFYGPYVDLFDSEDKADNYLDKVQKENWIARKERLKIK